jgi:hypothetical protein
MQAQESLPRPRPVRTFVMFEGLPCLIADILELEYKLVTISESPQYIYAHRSSLKDIDSSVGYDKPKPYQVSRFCDIMDVVYILWEVDRFGETVETIEFGFYVSVSYLADRITLINDKENGFVKSSPEKRIKQVFYFNNTKG